MTKKISEEKIVDSSTKIPTIVHTEEARQTRVSLSPSPVAEQQEFRVDNFTLQAALIVLALVTGAIALYLRKL